MSLETELVQLLSTLTSSDNHERSAGESVLNDTWIAERPHLLLLGLAEQIRDASDVALRSFSAVLFRRLASKDVSDPHESGAELSIWDKAGAETQPRIKSALLTSFQQEQIGGVRHKLSDLIAELTQIDEDWPEIRDVMLQCTQAPVPIFRESAFRVYGTSPELLSVIPQSQLHVLFATGLQDGDQTVQLAAVQAFSTFLITTTPENRKSLENLIPGLMNVLPPFLTKQDAESLTFALNAISELVEAYPKMFRDMFADLVNFCIATIREKQLENSSRQASLEVLVLFAESAPGMCRKDPNYTKDIIMECLSLMTDLGDTADTSEWLATEDLDQDESDANHVAGEQALDRLARKLGGRTILPAAFQWVPKLLASSKWQERHAALLALSSVAEGCEKLMRQELEKVLAMVLPCLQDSHPRVRWAACNAVGQMCTDFSGDIQEKYTCRVLDILTPVLDAPEARVAAHAAAAFVNFCENADQSTLEPYLDPVLERLLNLLRRPQKYVQEQAVTTIATVADAAETKFIKYYSAIMPLLMNVLRDASSLEYRLLRGKAMECATLIALAVGKEVFAPQAQELITLLGNIQNGVLDSDDPQSAYLMASWGRICKVLGTDFLPYLDAVMPPIIKAAKLKPDFTVIHDESEKAAFTENEGWEFFPLRGQQVGIKTSTLEEKNAAVSILVLYAQEMKAHFKIYAMEILREIALPGLFFYYHDGVRSASAQLIPDLLNCIKLAEHEGSDLLARAWNSVVGKLLDLMKSEPSIEMLGQVYQGFYESVEVVGSAYLDSANLDAVITSTESQLNDFIRRSASRAADHKAGDVDLEQDEDVLYEIELDDDLLSEISKTFHVLFKLLHAQFLPQWSRLLPILRIFSTSSESSCRQWSICVYDDVIEFCGPDAWPLKDHFIAPLASGLMDASAEVRQAAAYGIGCAAQHGGSYFAELVAQSLPSLFSVIAQPDARIEDNIYVTENACVSIAKICKFNSSQVQGLDEVVLAWVKTMPVTHDEQDAPYAYRYLSELMDSEHQAVISQLAWTIHIVAEAVSNAVLSGKNLANLIASTKTLLTRLPAEVSESSFKTLTSEKRELLLKHFN